MQILMGGIINGNIYYNFDIVRYGLGNIKMIENIISIGLTFVCGVLAMYWFIKGQGGY